MKVSSFCLLVLLGIALLLPITCVAQVTGATLAAIVSDPTGAGVPDASVTATNVSTGIASKTVTDSSGAYVFPSLSPGTYNITVEKTGFRTKTLSGVTLLVAQRADLGIPLELGDVTTSVEVNVQAPMVQSTTATVGTVIEAQQVHDLPLNTRRFGALAVLVPGTTIDRGGFAGGSLSSPFAETSFSADGSRSSGNNILIDGVMARALTGAGFSIQPTPDGVQEFKMNPYLTTPLWACPPGPSLTSSQNPALILIMAPLMSFFGTTSWMRAISLPSRKENFAATSLASL